MKQMTITIISLNSLNLHLCFAQTLEKRSHNFYDNPRKSCHFRSISYESDIWVFIDLLLKQKKINMENILPLARSCLVSHGPCQAVLRAFGSPIMHGRVFFCVFRAFETKSFNTCSILPLSFSKLLVIH